MPNPTANRIGLAIAAILAAGGLVAALQSYEPSDLHLALPNLATGWVSLAAGAMALLRRPGSWIGPLLIALGGTWFLADVRLTEWAWALHRGPLFHAVVLFPSGRPRTTADHALVAAGYLVAAASPLWDTEPMTALLGAAAVVAVLARYGAAGSMVRHALRPAVIVALVVGTAIVSGALVRLVTGDRGLIRPIDISYAFAIGWAAVVLAGSVSRRADASVTDVVVELGTRPASALTGIIADALGDPDLRLAVWSPARQAYVDDDGRALDADASIPGRRVTPLGIDGERVGLLVHDDSIVPRRVIEPALDAAARLLSANAALHREVTTRIAEVDASRRRLVQVGDAERRRLAERVHEQVIEPLARVPELVAGTRGPLAGGVIGAHRRAVTALDAFARGVHPPELTSGGLGPALTALAATSGVPTRVSVAPDLASVPLDVATTVYFCCAEALANANKHASPRSIDLRVGRAEGTIEASVSDDGKGGADLDRGSGLSGLMDRLAALGGSLTVESEQARGTIVRISLPLA